MVISTSYRVFLNQIRCPICKDVGDFSIVGANSGSAFTNNVSLLCKSCGASFAIQEGILNLLPSPRSNSSYWDLLYEEGVRGDPIRMISRARFLRACLNNIPSFVAYCSLVGVMNNLGVKFRSSIEIGCGSGYYSLMLKKLGLVEDCVLLDTSFSALKIAFQLFEIFGEDACFVLADGLEVPFADKSFDLSVSGGLIEHFRDSEQKKLVSEHCRVARSVACQVPTPSPFYWLQRGALTLLNAKWPFGHEKPISIGQLENSYRNEGFQLRSFAYHDFITMLLFHFSTRFRHIKPIQKKSIVNRLAKTEIAAYFTPKIANR